MAAVSIGTGMLVAGIVGGAGAAVKGVMEHRAAGQAADAQDRANGQAMTIEQEAEARRQEEYDRTEATNERRWKDEQDIEQLRYNTGLEDSRRKEAQDLSIYTTRQANLKPYREVGAGALKQLGDLAGVTLVPSATAPDMTAGWSSDRLSTPTLIPSTPPRTMGDVAKKKAAS